MTSSGQAVVTTSFHSFPVAHVRSDFAVLQNLSHNRLHVHDDIAEANVAIKTRFSVLIFFKYYGVNLYNFLKQQRDYLNIFNFSQNFALAFLKYSINFAE